MTPPITLGSDPELMLIDRRGRLRSAINVIPGTKARPIQTTYGQISHDNVLAEIGIIPATSADEWTYRHRMMLKELTKMVHPLRPILCAAAQYPDRELRCLEARTFGCDPDFDARLRERNIVPPDAAEKNLRTAGGHIHLGTHPNNPKLNQLLLSNEGRLTMVQKMDHFATQLDRHAPIRGGKQRRKLYGRAGCFRPKTYGIEYRTPSPAWLRDPETCTWAFQYIQKLALEPIRPINPQIINSPPASRAIYDPIKAWRLT